MSEKKFEASLKRLEQIVAKLESENLCLDDSLKLYEEGVKLSRFCAQKLQEAEKKVQTLSRTEDGSFSLQDFEASESEAGEEAKDE